MDDGFQRQSRFEDGHRWDDAIPYGKAFIEAAPDRIVWGTDWPHPQWRKRMMNDAEEVELLYRYVDGDPILLKKIVVDNPARLHRIRKNIVGVTITVNEYPQEATVITVGNQMFKSAPPECFYRGSSVQSAWIPDKSMRE